MFNFYNLTFIISNSKEGTLNTIRCSRKIRDDRAASCVEKAQVEVQPSVPPASHYNYQSVILANYLLNLLSSLRLHILICQMEPTVAGKEQDKTSKTENYSHIKC